MYFCRVGSVFVCSTAQNFSCLLFLCCCMTLMEQCFSISGCQTFLKRADWRDESQTAETKRRRKNSRKKHVFVVNLKFSAGTFWNLKFVTFIETQKLDLRKSVEATCMAPCNRLRHLSIKTSNSHCVERKCSRQNVSKTRWSYHQQKLLLVWLTSLT